MSHRFLLGLLVASFAASVGCTPATQFRRAAVVPTPGGETITNPVRGRAELSGSVSYTDTNTDILPAVNDPALHATNTLFSGQARFKLSEIATLGFHGLYSHSTFSTPTALGTPPMEDESIIGVGPSFSLHFLNTSRVRLGLGVAITGVSVPWSVWERRSTAPPEPEEFIDIDASNYDKIEEGRDLLLLGRLSFGINVILHRYVEMFGGLSVQNSFKNIGFDNQEREGSTLDARSLGVVPYLGVTARVPGGFFMQAQYYYPMGFSQFRGNDILGVTSWGGLQFGIGVNLGSDEDPRHAPPVREPQYAPEQQYPQQQYPQQQYPQQQYPQQQQQYPQQQYPQQQQVAPPPYAPAPQAPPTQPSSDADLNAPADPYAGEEAPELTPISNDDTNDVHNPFATP